VTSVPGPSSLCEDPDVKEWTSPPEDPALAAARILLYELDVEPPDVLILGESTLLFFGPEESDRRPLADLLVEALHPESALAIAGPGFGVELHREFVRLAATRAPRPLVVTSLYVRGTLPAFLHHPLWGHRRQLDLLTRVTGHSEQELSGPYVPPTAEEYAAYEARPYPTFVADRTIGEFMDELRPPPNPFSREHLKWLFEFHTGGSPDPQVVQAFTEFGRLLKESGFPVIAFQNPVDVIQGTELLGPDFAQRHRRNTAMVRDAFVAGYGPDAVILETADRWQSADFIEPAVEHLAAHARVRLAGIIAAAAAAMDRVEAVKPPGATLV
jgi:hypothetical protein